MPHLSLGGIVQREMRSNYSTANQRPCKYALQQIQIFAKDKWFTPRLQCGEFHNNGWWRNSEMWNNWSDTKTEGENKFTFNCWISRLPPKSIVFFVYPPLNSLSSIQNFSLNSSFKELNSCNIQSHINQYWKICLIVIDKMKSFE